MEEVVETFTKLKLKAKKVEEEMIVIAHKPKLNEKLSELNKTSKETETLRIEITAMMKDHENRLKKQYTSTTKTIQRCQMKMMYLLQYLEDTDQQRASNNGAIKRGATASNFN